MVDISEKDFNGTSRRVRGGRIWLATG